MNIKLYTAEDAVRIGKNALGKETYELYIELPSGQRLRLEGEYPTGLAESANQIIMSEVNKEVSIGPYTEAVKHLSKMVLTQDGSGARAAAQVLLSTYNGTNYQLDVTDLCHLDADNFLYAQAIISGRVHTLKEPHTVIENGGDIFDQIERKWSWLNVRNRYKDYYSD